MKTQYYTATSLDGFIATTDHSLEWLFPLGDIADTGYDAFIRDVGALAMGASTYEWMLRNAIQPVAVHCTEMVGTWSLVFGNSPSWRASRGNSIGRR